MKKMEKHLFLILIYVGRNWIHAGSYTSAANTVFNDIDGDPDGVFEDVVNGTWAPYRLVSPYLDGPGYSINTNFSSTTYSLPQSQLGNRMRNLQSIKVVITDDKSLVVKMCSIRITR